MNIALIGYGKMGKEIEAVAAARGMTIVQRFNRSNNRDGSGLTESSLAGVDVCIDFSSPDVVVKNIGASLRFCKRMVVGTTGWYDKLDEVRDLVARHDAGFLYASNFSPGVNMFVRLVGEAARMLEQYEEYDVSVTETHHRGKADSPSGTALWLAQEILRQMKRKTEILRGTPEGPIGAHQLQVTSVRTGNIPGRHTVMFDSDVDTVELLHTAKSRRGFAAGALLAAEWLVKRKGFFTMDDVIDGQDQR